jgi:prepilin-type N-terminal cleavage/methylation domain-containing protein
MTTRHASRRLAGARGQRGVTVLELIVAMSMFALVASGIYSLVNVGGRSITTTNDLLQSQAQVRAAIDNLVDEMRWAQSVTAAGPTSVTVLVPQSTPFSPTSPYTATFAYDAATDTLIRQVDPDAAGPQAPGASEPIAFGVVQLNGSDGLSFEYYDGTGVSLGSTPADLASVVRVRMTVTTTRDRTSRTIASDVALRGR